MSDRDFISFMPQALALAREAGKLGEVPVGAVVVEAGQVVGSGYNRTRIDRDPTAHAEIVAIRDAAAQIGDDRLSQCDLWVTLEPCTMCAGAIAHSRIRRLYYGASDHKGGAVESGVRFFDAQTCHHKPEIYTGMQEAEAAELLRTFFRERRA